jgi:hypothetical protein
MIVIDQLDAAVDVISEDLGSNLKESLLKVLSKEIDQRPAVQMLALIKHFDSQTLTTLRQLDEISSEFDPVHKAHFLSQTLVNALPDIPEVSKQDRVIKNYSGSFRC